MIGLDAVLGRPSPGAAGEPPDADRPETTRSARGLWVEAAGGWQLARLVRAAPWLAAAPRGNGDLVLDLPGWRAPEVSNAPLRAYLRLLGHDARGWGLGTNTGAVERDVARLVTRLTPDPHAPKVTLVGWSLGGVIAREAARRRPDRVAQVVTFGTPVVLGRLDIDRPIAVPITAIYTRRDGVVDWRACIDRRTPHVRHIEVRSTHLSLGVDPDVWWTIARALAQRPAPDSVAASAA